jgi:hypothetical protein
VDLKRLADWISASAGMTVSRSARVLQMTMVPVTLKLNERTANVIENKGPAWKTCGLGLYAYGNKRT